MENTPIPEKETGTLSRTNLYTRAIWYHFCVRHQWGHVKLSQWIAKHITLAQCTNSVCDELLLPAKCSSGIKATIIESIYYKIAKELPKYSTIIESPSKGQIGITDFTVTVRFLRD